MRAIAERLRGRSTTAAERDARTVALVLVTLDIYNDHRTFDEVRSVGTDSNLHGLSHYLLLLPVGFTQLRPETAYHLGGRQRRTSGVVRSDPRGVRRRAAAALYSAA
jgi:hypothetical protein